MADFTPCIEFTLRAEGGYVDDPRDPGGATNMGITIATLSAWRGRQCTSGDVRNLSQTEAKDVFEANYWHVVGGPVLPEGLDLAVFDFAVNAGPVRSVEMLQRAVGAAPDGHPGPVTLARACGSPAVIRSRIVALCNAHEAYYHGLAEFAHDGRGWSARVSACMVQALALAAGTAASVTPALPKPQMRAVTRPVPVASPAQSTADELDNAFNPGA